MREHSSTPPPLINIRESFPRMTRKGIIFFVIMWRAEKRWDGFRKGGGGFGESSDIRNNSNIFENGSNLFLNYKEFKIIR